MDSIYLDHNSTTPMLAEVAAAMAPWQTARFGNPASQHQVGRGARQALETARDGIAHALGAGASGHAPARVIFTSGGTEANNLALLSMAGWNHPRSPPGEAILSAIEHPSVEAVAEQLARRGWTIHHLRVTHSGIVDLAALDKMLRRETRFVSVMLANNETGVVQPIVEVAQRCAALGVPLHTDAAQAVGKVPVDFAALGVSSMSVAAHKFHGPLGIGALIARHDAPLEPLLFGGFQQAGLRPGTEPVALAVGLHAALTAWQREAGQRTARLQSLRDRLEARLVASCEVDLEINGAEAERLPHTTNVAFLGINRQALLMALDLAGVCCSTGSACASGSSEPSRVLQSMGCREEVLASSLRFSLGATTTPAEIDEAAVRIATACASIGRGKPRSAAPS